MPKHSPSESLSQSDVDALEAMYDFDDAATLPTFAGVESHFTYGEVKCKQTGELPPVDLLISWPFQALSTLLSTIRGDSPLTVTSWHRAAAHPIEAAKQRPGPHTTGLAADILLSRNRAYHAIREATLFADLQNIRLGLGVAQKGGVRFLHIDFAYHADARFFRPTVWSY